MMLGACSVKIVCQNTESHAHQSMKASKGYKLKHTRQIGRIVSDQAATLEDARKAMGIASSETQRILAWDRHLAAQSVKESEALDFFSHLVTGKDRTQDWGDVSAQARRKVGELHWMYGNGTGQDVRGATAYGLKSAVTGWLSDSSFRSQRENGTSQVAYALGYSAGSGAELLQTATDMLVQQYQYVA